VVAAALPFYRVQFIAYLMHDLENARWLWERVPAAVRSDEEIIRIWGVAKLLWNNEMSAAYAQLSAAGWKDAAVQGMAAKLVDDLRRDKVDLVAKSHSTISVESCAQLLGMSREEAVARCQSLGWAIEGDFIKPVKSRAVMPQLLNSDELQALTEYVCSLDTK